MDQKTDKKYKKILVDQIPLALTFDDLLMIPQYSEVTSRTQVSLKSHFSKNINLEIPIVSSPMDTVTEDQMAVEMARNGGLGVVHRFQTIEDQAKMVEKIKRSESFVIVDPWMVNKETTIEKVKQLSIEHRVSTFLVIEENRDLKKENSDSSIPKRKYSEVHEALLGIITKRDIKSAKSTDTIVNEVMTPREKLIVYEVQGIDPQPPKPKEILDLMRMHKIEKIPLVNNRNGVCGIITYKDLIRLEDTFTSNLNNVDGSLVVAAAVGAKEDFEERTLALIEKKVDGIVIDIANGHSKLCIDTIETLRDICGKKVDIIAGSIASGEGAERLIRAGADGIRCGIGNGSICTTRIISGAGVPQFTALCDVAPICKEYDIPLISDGGNGNSGNMCKALAAGADCIMLGRLVAGCEESPSKVIYKDGKLSKVYRGMAGLGANISKSQKITGKDNLSSNFNAEGVEGYIPYAGPLKDVLSQFTNGIRSGMSYSGARNIVELQENARFIRITTSGKKESGVHNIKQFS